MKYFDNSSEMNKRSLRPMHDTLLGNMEGKPGKLSLSLIPKLKTKKIQGVSMYQLFIPVGEMTYAQINIHLS